MRYIFPAVFVGFLLSAMALTDRTIAQQGETAAQARVSKYIGDLVIQNAAMSSQLEQAIARLKELEDKCGKGPEKK